jgi:hypothetical protein
MYVAAPFSDNPKQAGKVMRWFDCTRSCILKKFNEFYKVYDGGASQSDVNLTPYWKKACNVCVGKPEAKTETTCCKAMVVAEQNGLEDCKGNCGPFPGNSTALPIPGFSGDFSKLEDRIAYGFKKCCPDNSNTSKTTPKL